MKVEMVKVAALKPDPANARKHDKRNLEAIEKSLEKFGQRKPVVVQATDLGLVVLAGNGTVEAAKALGWTEVAATRVPSEWTWDQARAYALADNRTAELAAWDADLLSDQLLELDANGWELEDIGFQSLDPTAPPPDSADALPLPDASKYREQYGVIVMCVDEVEQETVYNTLAAQNYKVRVVTT